MNEQDTNTNLKMTKIKNFFKPMAELRKFYPSQLYIYFYHMYLFYFLFLIFGRWVKNSLPAIQSLHPRHPRPPTYLTLPLSYVCAESLEVRFKSTLK